MQSFTPKFLGTDYLEQWERVQRWYQKVNDVGSNLCQKSGVPIEEQEDYLYFYFLNLVNLGEWVKNGSRDSSLVKKFWKNVGVECLQVCSDFVNNFKHYDNSKNTKLHQETFFISRDAQSGGGGPVHTWWIQAKNGRKNVYELAKECYQEVETFMKSKKYI